jgi:hypothetical protein
MARLHQFRLLKVRYDRRDDLHQAFLDLAVSLICFRKWSNRFCSVALERKSWIVASFWLRARRSPR